MTACDLHCPLKLSAPILTQGQQGPALRVREDGTLRGGLRGPGPHQDELVVGQLAGPVGFGAVPLKESLCAMDLVLILPRGQTLQAGKPLVTVITVLAAGAETTGRTGQSLPCREATHGPCQQGTEAYGVQTRRAGHRFMGNK